MKDRTIVIKPRSSFKDIDLKEIWHYRDLIFLFVKRNLKTIYKQTVLGPLWLVLSPIISAVISAFVFGGIAKISSEGLPYFLFFMCANTVWSFFAYGLNHTSNTFVSNSRLFGKVYFPRLISPISSVITGFVNFLIQVVIFLIFTLYYALSGVKIQPNLYLLLLPVLILQVAALSLGFGIIISSLTAKYRDLSVLFSFGVNLWMYITPVIYSASSLSGKIKILCMLNPMAPIIETVRHAVFGTGEFPFVYWLISLVVTLVVLCIGIIIFNRVEKTFMDTV